jgi:poly(hydroxyalkanoate) depolymerase family esterase
MNALPKVDMEEVARLTRAGRLQEAMAMIRQGLAELPGAEAEKPPSDDDGPTIDMAPVGGEASAWGLPDFTAELSALRSAKTGPLERARGGAKNFDGRSPNGAMFDERSFSNEAGTRTYKLYVPSRHEQPTAPLVVMLHGCSQSPDDFAAGARMNELAEEEGFFVVYPAQAQAANSQKCWNWFSVGDQQRNQGEPSLIAGITRQVMADFAVDPTRVYVAGLSAGGAAATIMGSAYPDLYAAVGVHSGLACGAAGDLSSAFTAMRQGGVVPPRGGQRPTPTIVFHGDNDQTVNSVNAEQVIVQARAGARLRKTTTEGEAAGGMPFTRIAESDRDGHTILEQWTLHGGGHAWSGGSLSGTFTDPRGPDASREMMRFFRQHKTSGV